MMEEGFRRQDSLASIMKPLQRHDLFLAFTFIEVEAFELQGVLYMSDR